MSKQIITLENVNNKITKLTKEFHKFEKMVYEWKHKDLKDIDELKQFLKLKGELK